MCVSHQPADRKGSGRKSAVAALGFWGRPHPARRTAPAPAARGRQRRLIRRRRAAQTRPSAALAARARRHIRLRQRSLIWLGRACSGGPSEDAQSLPPPWQALLNPARERAQATSEPQARSKAAKNVAAKRRGAVVSSAVREAVPAREGDAAAQERREARPEAEAGESDLAQGQGGAGPTSARRAPPGRQAAGKGSEGSSPLPDLAGSRSAQAHTERRALPKHSGAALAAAGNPREERVGGAASDRPALPVSGGKQQAASVAAADMRTPDRERQRAAGTPARMKRQQQGAPPGQTPGAKRRRGCGCGAKTGLPVAGGQRSLQASAELSPAAPDMDLSVADNACATPDQAIFSVLGKKLKGSPRVPGAAAVHGESPASPKSDLGKGHAAQMAGRVSKRERSSVKAAKPWWVV